MVVVLVRVPLLRMEVGSQVAVHVQLRCARQRSKRRVGRCKHGERAGSIEGVDQVGGVNRNDQRVEIVGADRGGDNVGLHGVMIGRAVMIGESCGSTQTVLSIAYCPGAWADFGGGVTGVADPSEASHCTFEAADDFCYDTYVR